MPEGVSGGRGEKGQQVNRITRAIKTARAYLDENAGGLAAAWTLVIVALAFAWLNIAAGCQAPQSRMNIGAGSVDLGANESTAKVEIGSPAPEPATVVITRPASPEPRQ